MKNRLMAVVLSAVLISGCVSIPVLANEDMTEIAFDSIDEADAQELIVEDDSSELDFADIEAEEEDTQEETGAESSEEESTATEDDFSDSPEDFSSGSANVRGIDDEIGGNITWYYPGGIFPTDTTVAGEGCILLGLEGEHCGVGVEYYINQYREEACREGFPDPRDPSRKLTMDDYIPVSWSSDMEYIARIRSAETSVMTTANSRPNGKEPLSLKSPNGLESFDEIQGWTNNEVNVSDNICELWYQGKTDWVNQNGSTYNAYAKMINPDNYYVGASDFKNLAADQQKNDIWKKVVVAEFSRIPNLDEDESYGVHCIQTIEIQKKLINYTFIGLSHHRIKPGRTMDATLKFKVGDNSLVYIPDVTDTGSVTWESDHPEIAAVDENGTITSVAPGVTVIRASTAGGWKASTTLTVEKNTVDIGDTDISIDNFTYTGSKIQPTLEIKYTGKDFDPAETLKEGRDYTWSYTDAVNAGETITITINGKGNYSGTVTKKVKVIRKRMDDFKIKGIVKIKTYTGKPIVQNMTILDDNLNPVAPSNYTVKYVNNVKPGIVQIRITGKGNYTAGTTRYFYITPPKMKKPSLKSTKNQITVTYQKAVGATGYQISYSMDKKTYKHINASSKATRVTLRKLSSKKTYYVKVRAYKQVDGVRYYGPYSDIRSIKTK